MDEMPVQWGRQANLDGQVVLITGGSRGLGLALAREFARAGCRLVLTARDAQELVRAQQDLRSSPSLGCVLSSGIYRTQ